QPTTYPLSELFADLAKTLPSYLRTTNAVFCRVIVNKLDEYGLPRTIMYPNATTKSFRILAPQFSYIVNTETGKLYYDEPRFVIGIKCLLIFFATPLYTLGIMIWNAHQIMRSMVIIARNALDSVREDLMYGRLFDAARILAKEINPFPGILK